MASIVIPAHNEARVIGRTLQALADGTLRPGTRVVVACNGCTDGTEQIAQGFADRLQLDVLDLPVASKQAALNGADAHLAQFGDDGFPRVYLDADITAPAGSVNRVLDVLEGGPGSSGAGVLAARPPLAYRTEQADPLVKAFYRARSRTPEVLRALWGAGFYAVSRAGRQRWADFPLDAPDDLFVDSLFGADEKTVVDAPSVEVEVPRRTAALLATLKRVYRPSEQISQAAGASEGAPASSGNTLKGLLRANSKRPADALDALCYIGFAAGARLALKLERGGRDHSGQSWERDETTRGR